VLTQFKFEKGLQKAIERLGYSQATPVQEKTIPLSLEKKDLLVSAKTGSGKTAAYLLPILQHLLTAPAASNTGTLALILVPTRELARQVHKYSQTLAQHTPLTAGVITGGDDFKYQRSMLRKNPEIIVATPGRLLEHIERSSIDLQDLQYLILDEADRMLDMGFADEVLTITSQCNKQRQTMLFSATLQQKDINRVAGNVLLAGYQKVIIDEARHAHQQIQQQIILADDHKHKQKLLTALLKQESYQRCLVFTNTRDGADRLGAHLRYKDIRCGVLHGEMRQDDRRKILELFTKGSFEVLVATDVAARGLDIKGIERVINFDMARSGDEYIHRIGRTGRAETEGRSISLISANEWNLMISIERYLRTNFERRSLDELKAKFQGPKKQKSSGKSAGSKNKKQKKALADKKTTKKKSAAKKSKATKSSKKPSPVVINDGFAPIKRKT